MNAGHPAPGSPIGSAVAYWKLNDGTGTTAQDSSLNNNDLTLSSASWTNNGKFDKAFNGTGGAIRMSRSSDPDLEFSASESASFSLWFKSDSATKPIATEYLMANGGPTGSAGYAIYVNTSGLICFGIDDDTSWGPGVVSCSTRDFYDNSWHNITAVRNVVSDNISLFVDAIQYGIATDTTSASLYCTSTFFIGDIDTDDAASGEEF